MLRVAVITWALLLAGQSADPPPDEAPPDETPAAAPTAVDAAPALAAAPAYERDAIQKLVTSSSWAKRAIAAVRLERFACDDSRGVLVRLLADETWQVRVFAVRALGRRRVAAGEDWFANEDDPRVLRAALRHRYAIDPERIARGCRYLAKQPGLDDKMLAVELAVAGGRGGQDREGPEGSEGAEGPASPTDPDNLQDLARETLRTIILRMQRSDAGVLSPRLAAVTGATDVRRHYLWQKWLRRAGRRFELRPAFSVPETPETIPLSLLAALEPQHFANLRNYIETLQDRSVDLAIVIDTTGSMSGELGAAQGGLDDLMIFASAVVGEFRVAIVAYRDRRNRYETKGWDFTSDVSQARDRLWSLTADEGGDTPEAVYPALRQAYTELTWIPGHTMVLVLIGDAPPHVGFGSKCVRLAGLAYESSELVTHTIQTEGRDVDHFREIAEAGHGRAVSLEDDDSLIPEITGLTLGSRFGDELREFFAIYLELCR